MERTGLGIGGLEGIRSRARAVLTAQTFALLIGFSSQLYVPLPFSPVPLSTQTLAVLLAGAYLGARRGFLAVLLFLAEGVLGLPFFAGGAAGLTHLLGPTGGFLLGFAPAAFLTGLLAERGWMGRLPLAAAALLIGTAAVYAAGLPWLGAFVGARSAVPLGLLPFIPGDLIKVGIASILLRLAARWRAGALRP